MFYVKNIPGWERAVRIAAGAGTAALAYTQVGGMAGMVIAASAAGIALTGLVGFCPMCAMVGRRLDRSGSLK